MKKRKNKWKKRVALGALAAGGAYAAVKTKNAYDGIMKMVENRDDDERKIVEKFAKSYYYIGSDQEFNGAAIGAMFCSLRVEMQNAKIDQDCEIELGCLMSSVTIYVPENIHVEVNVKVRSGMCCWTAQNALPPDAEGPTLRIYGTSSMSSVVVQTMPRTSTEDASSKEETAAKDDGAEETKNPFVKIANKITEAIEETIPSGGPITDDEPEETSEEENSGHVIFIRDLDAEVSDTETEPEPEASEEANEPEEVTKEINYSELEEAAETDADDGLEADEPALGDVEEDSDEGAETDMAEEPEAVEETEEDTAVEDSDETTEVEDATEDTEAMEAAEAVAEETTDPVEEEPSEDEEAAEPEAAEDTEEAESDDEESEVFDEDLDEDDDFAGDDRRKRMPQDQIDAILDRLADEYEERGGEE